MSLVSKGIELRDKFALADLWEVPIDRCIICSPCQYRRVTKKGCSIIRSSLNANGWVIDLGTPFLGMPSSWFKSSAELWLTLV